MGKLAGYCKFIMLNSFLHGRHLVASNSPFRPQGMIKPWQCQSLWFSCEVCHKTLCPRKAWDQECMKTSEVDCSCGKPVLTQFHAPPLRGKANPSRQTSQNVITSSSCSSHGQEPSQSSPIPNYLCHWLLNLPLVLSSWGALQKNHQVLERLFLGAQVASTQQTAADTVHMH